MKNIFFLLFSCILLFSFSFKNAQAKEIIEIKSAWLNEYEIFPVWYAHDKGKDREKGYNFNIQIYPTGKRLADSIHSDNWIIGVSGLVPALQSIINDKSSIISIGSDETNINDIFVRENSDILSVKGENPNFPNIYGNSKLVRGKTVLCPLGTNSHQLLLAWLNIIGLKDTDVMIVDTKPEDALNAFKDGFGDIVVLWAPNTYLAKEEGLKVAASAVDCNATFKTVLYAKKSALDNSPELIRDFLDIYINSIEEIQAMSTEDAGLLYREYQKKYANLEISFESAKQTILEQTLYNRKEQAQELFNKNSNFYKTLMSNIDFYAFINALPRRDIDFLKNADYLIYDLNKK